MYGGHLRTTATQKITTKRRRIAFSFRPVPAKSQMPGPNFLGLTAAPDLPPPCEDGAPQSQSGGKGLSSSGHLSPSHGRQPASVPVPLDRENSTPRRHDVDGNHGSAERELVPCASSIVSRTDSCQARIGCGLRKGRLVDTGWVIFDKRRDDWPSIL